MPDKAHEQTDKELKRLERQITKEYSQAAKEVEKKLTDYLEKFAKKDAEMQKKVASGQMSAEEYGKWRVGQMAMGERWKEMQKTLTEDLVNADKIAAGMINDSLPSAYALNYNYGTYEVEHGAEIDTSFSLYDHATVENLMKKDPKIIPQARVDIPKDELWNRRKLTSAITQGILQGEAIPKIAKRLASVADMDRKAAIRNARTYTTAAENKGRIDSYDRAKDMGINVKKEWLATLDERTRMEHRHLDGMAVDNDEPFEVDGYTIMYPGDPDAEPEMIYNCRCTLVARIVDYKYNDERNDSKLGDMTYEEWKHAKDKGYPKEEIKQEEKISGKKETLHTDDIKTYEYFEKMKGKEIEYIDVKEYENIPTSEEIIEKLAGGDMTKGSCASLAVSYCANKCGLDVTDYRDGASRAVFSRRMNVEAIYKLANADIEQLNFTNRVASNLAKALEEKVEENKEYAFCAGKHEAIVRKVDGVLQYLELQSSSSNGWKDFIHTETIDMGKWGTKTYNYTVVGTLQERFGVVKSNRSLGGIKVPERALLIDVSSVQPTEEFKDILGLINTNEKDQRKGAAGSEK